MEKLKQLVEDFYNYTINVSISENELYNKNYEELNDVYKKYLSEDQLYKKIVEKVKSEILYDFIYDIDNIRKQVKNDKESYEEEDINSYSWKKINEIETKIKKIFKNY